MPFGGCLVNMNFDLPATHSQPSGPVTPNNLPILLGYAGAITYENAEPDEPGDTLLARAIVPLIDAAKALVDASAG